MLSKILIKLIDYAIFPAVLIVAAKILGIVFLLNYFGISYEVTNLTLVLSNVSDFIIINTYSSLFMLVAILAGLFWVTVKAHVFHDTHISPMLSAKLFGMNLEQVIHTNEVIFSQSLIWLTYSWLATVMFGVQAYFGLADWWLFYLALVCAIFATSLLALDIEREIRSDVEDFDVDANNKTRVISFSNLRNSWE